MPIVTSTGLATGTKTDCITVSSAKGVFQSADKFALAQGQSKFTLSASRNSWPDTGAAVISVQADISFDGGQSWQLLCGFTANGGNSLDQFGKPSMESSFTVDAPQPDNLNRVVRVATNTKSPITTTVAVKAQ